MRRLILALLLVLLPITAHAVVQTTQLSQQYTGNGVTTAFSIPYAFDKPTDIVLTINGVQQLYTTAYTVAKAVGIAGGTLTTVAIPAMFGYNFLVTSIRGMIVEMDNFAAELASEFEHKYVDHNARDPEYRR
jgi:hypothetical protein